MAASKLERLLRTDKQKRFDYDFLKDTEKLECWEDVVVGEEYDSEQTFEVTGDDLVMFAEASLDSNPPILRRASRPGFTLRPSPAASDFPGGNRLLVYRQGARELAAHAGSDESRPAHRVVRTAARRRYHHDEAKNA